MQQVNTDIITCVRAALNAQTADCNVSGCLGLAYQHGLVNLLYYVLAKDEQADPNLKSTLKQCAYAEIIRETHQRKRLEEILRRFEESKIRCTVLKGAAIKDLYPKSELRYMSDIDILIDAEKAETVKEHFLEMGCRILKYDQGNTDQYLSAEGLNFEVKKTLCSESFNKKTREFLTNLLALAEPVEGRRYICALPNEEHYAYILCHIVKHLIHGGVGIRPIMDVWVCKNYMKFDSEKLSQLLAELELTDFAATIEHLAQVWFGNAQQTPIDEELGNYIIASGSFGTEEQRVADRMITQNNRFLYTLKRLFPPYQTMRRYFPSLKKCPILLPFYWIWRWIRIVIFGRKKLGKELQTVGSMNSESLKERMAFYRRCGLNINQTKGNSK